MVLVSMIVPFYHGQQYLDKILHTADANARILTQNERYREDTVELILINDSPEEPLKVSSSEEWQKATANPSLDIRVMENPMHLGIHQTRVNALKESRGRYIHFLDQDDEVSADFLASQLDAIGQADMVVANGIAQEEAGRKKLYRYAFMQWTVRHIWFYARFDSRIISPGQCLIKRDAIPQKWTQHVLSHSGSDDYMLWLMMLSAGKRFAINRRELYTHVDTGENTSGSYEKIEASVREIVHLNKEYDLFDRDAERLIRKRLKRGGKKSVLVKVIEDMNR